MAGEIPEDGPAFEAMMCEIDAELIKQGVAITARPIMAARHISLKFGVDFPIFDPGPHAPPELRRYGPLSDKVGKWFKHIYGRRLDVDHSPGRIVINIDSDLYQLRYPRFWGQGEFVISRRFLPKAKLEINKPFRGNIIELINDMTEGKAGLISSETIQSMFDWFPIGLRVFYSLESNSDIELLRIARSDIETAVDKLMGPGNRYADSKWSSLQAVEKCLKAAISLENEQYKKEHSLKGLAKQLADMGIDIGHPELLDKIQARGGIRYGEIQCTRDESLVAHRASIQVIDNLFGVVRKFRSELTIRKVGIGSTETYEVVKTIRPRVPDGLHHGK